MENKQRKLASVQVIRDIQPIEGADRIEVATINNWKVVVAKNEGYKVGDKVIYFEIDSFLPIRPEFEFLRKTSYKKLSNGEEGFRLKTIKMKNQISQGLIIPLAVAQEMYKTYYNSQSDIDWHVGQDVTEVLGVKKYEPPIPAKLGGRVKGQFPSFIPKTDEERVQNLTDQYQEWVKNNERFVFTEKLDGTSFTCYFNKGEFGVCSRNLELLDDGENIYWKVAKNLQLQEKLSKLGKNIALQGELIGEGIQGNRYKIKGHDIYFFTAFDIDSQKRYTTSALQNLLSELQLKIVPLVNVGYLNPNIDEQIKSADGISLLNGSTIREGLVVRSDNGISFKIISNKFLLNEK